MYRYLTVLDLTREPVTGTPSISVISNSIIFRRTIYKKSISILRKVGAIYTQAHGIVFVHLYMTHSYELVLEKLQVYKKNSNSSYVPSGVYSH